MKIPNFLTEKNVDIGRVIRCDSTCRNCGSEKRFNYIFIKQDREVCILCRDCHTEILNKEARRAVKHKMTDTEKLILEEILINRSLILQSQKHIYIPPVNDVSPKRRKGSFNTIPFGPEANATLLSC